jgi:hypothetical protein
MFIYHEDSRLLWFNPDSLESNQEFELIGILLGIAIYNSIIIELKMPSAVYKNLKNRPLDIKDLEELSLDSFILSKRRDFDGMNTD